MKTPNLKAVGDMRAAIFSGLYSLWDLAFLHLFFFLVFIFNRRRTGSVLVSCFLSDIFHQAGTQEASQVGRLEPLAQETSLTQNFTITQVFSTSPLNRAFGKNHVMPLPSQ